MTSHKHQRVAQTGGRSWDGSLQVYNNPVPRGWTLLLAGTAVLAMVSWLLYPSWPLPGAHYAGLIEIELDSPDGQFNTPWSSSAEFQARQDDDETTLQRRRLTSSMLRADLQTLDQDPHMLAFALAAARVPYRDNCAACHGHDGHGVSGLGPALSGDQVLARKGLAFIEQAVRAGGHATLPDRGQIAATAGPVPSCDGCHATPADSGLAQSSSQVGAPVGKPAASTTVTNGQYMPAWGERLSALEIRSLTVYVYRLARTH